MAHSTMDLLDPTAPPLLLTAGLPGTGGVIKDRPEDFEVEEILGRDPEGDGDHLYLWVEKRGVSAEALARHFAQTLGARPEQIGTAGLKDTCAVTRQWLSAPAACAARLAAVESERIRVLKTTRGHAKLRAGQLEGNRFNILIREPAPGAAPRAAAVVAKLSADGLPNYYGAQRFGRDGSTARAGLALLAGGRGAKGGFHLKLALSAAQALLFNTWLAARHRDGRLHRVVDGEVLQTRATALPMWADDLERAQQRFDAGEVVAMGPMFGPRMRRAKREAAAREDAVLAAARLGIEDFAAFGKLCHGTRRPALVRLSPIDLKEEPEGIRLRFDLPSGSYATVLLAEIMKG